MAVVGVDFGTLASKIGVARHRGIDIITNEVSNRATPSLVAFGPKSRFIGEQAKTQETSNFKNTIGSLKRLIGRSLSPGEVEEVEKKFLNAKLVDGGTSGTEVGVEVNYLGSRQTFTFTQLVAMYLSRLRDTAAAELKTNVSDIVIAVPGWFTESQRRAIIDAASISSLNVLRLINDTTAAALGYGITKSSTDLPDADNPKHVAFVDVGHSTLSVAIVAFSKGQLTVKATAYDRNLGGRDIDYALLQHFAAEFKTKYKIDVLSNPKAVFRLVAAAEKLKKVLSANAEAPINVESIMNDVDASGKLTRDELESLIADVLSRIEPTVQRALADAQANGVTEIDSVELIGGSTRVPAVRQRIATCFPGKTLSTTLNQDEAVARGATFACAMLSPVFRVREFGYTDIASWGLKIQWDAASNVTPPGEEPEPEEDTELVVFPKGNGVPSTKILTFWRQGPFEIEAVYAEGDGEALPGGVNKWVGKFSSKELPKVAAPSDSVQVKLKTRLNGNGVMSFEGAYVETREEIPVESSPAPMEGVEGAAAEEKEKPKKKKVVKHDVRFISSTPSLDKSVVESLKEQENQMWENDKLVKDTEDRKNALEEYIYDTRSKLSDGGRYFAFASPSQKEYLFSLLAKHEDWLYTEEGEDATKSVYVSRLDECQKSEIETESGSKKLGGGGEKIAWRWREFEGRPKAIAQLRETLDTYDSAASSGDEKYSHIDDAEKQKVVEKVALTRKWLEDLSIKQMELNSRQDIEVPIYGNEGSGKEKVGGKAVDPVLTIKEIEKKRDEVIYFVTPILNKPKPKPPVVPGAGSTPGSGTQTPKTDGEPKKEEKGDQGPTEMDVD